MFDWESVEPLFGIANPDFYKERLIKSNGIIGGITVETDFDDVWSIVQLRAITRGGGRLALQQFLNFADNFNKTVECIAVPGRSPGGIEMSLDQLIRWYETFGFIESGVGLMTRKSQRIDK